MTNRPNEPPMPEPLAYFLTWHTYGTWLPGDERGWVRRRRGEQPPNASTQRQARSNMTEEPCVLDHQQRQLVERTIAEHCQARGWVLHVVNCRTNHVHVVVTGSADPRRMLVQFKAWTTRRLNELDIVRKQVDRQASSTRRQWWTERGSTRILGDEAGFEAAILYVRDGQDRKV